MRIGRAHLDGSERTVIIEDGEAGPDTPANVLPPDAPSVDDYIRDPGAAADMRVSQSRAVRTTVGCLMLMAPIARFRRDILCTGWNYWDHFEESRGKREGQDPAERPVHPTFFTKAPGAIIGPTDPIAFDAAVSTKWDFEAELAVVIGTGGRSIPETHAERHLAGLLVANDVSQRDVQRAHGGQWLKGKSIDGCSPIGPWLTTMDSVEDIQNLDISLTLNDVTMQSANTGQMAFTVAQLIAELSSGMTLHAGDVILTGTPAGVGNAREPQVFLQPGDTVVTAIDGLGSLRNVVTRTDLSSYAPVGDNP